MTKPLFSCSLLFAAGAVLADPQASKPWPASPITDHFAIRGGWMQGSVDTVGRKTLIIRRDGPNGEILQTPKTEDESEGGGDD